METLDLNLDSNCYDNMKKTKHRYRFKETKFSLTWTSLILNSGLGHFAMSKHLKMAESGQCRG